MKFKLILFIVLCAGAIACVGTDIVNDSTDSIPARIELTPDNSAVQVNDSATFQASFYDTLGSLVPGVAFEWMSLSSDIASIDADGRALGLQPGQTMISASANGIASEFALLTVVADANRVASIALSPQDRAIGIGEILRFTATARNLEQQPVPGVTFAWQSSDSDIVSIDSTGLATALQAGNVRITAIADDVESSATNVTVLAQALRGTFVRQPGTSYSVRGTATLTRGTAADGSFSLTFGDDFSTSNGPRLHVFLSNSNTVNGQSLDLGLLQRTSGAQSYDADISAQNFNWVIIHCVPFNVTFGFAELQ